MYLLEIELLKQEDFSTQHQLLLKNSRQGDYYFEKNSKNNRLQELAKEFWLYREAPCSAVHAKAPVADCHHEKLFRQQIQESAQQLVTTLAQKPLTIAQILQQLEREQPDFIPLGKTSLGSDILRSVDNQHSLLEAWRIKEDATLKDCRL
ncbi:hypothetical protein SAMN05216522_106136 [Rosenbergiella nectarea]|uniref:Uncharacterized protein n=1 Tax=Rosenbergiella nectarea TaxID=988801 RepID=A0A1H9IQ32_9GAMM|nr:hypothetical protein [Rosenbergiella nectarea]SEQ76505.1 hypothetical protein SAMN05216522_106136 [Rosenbergiella nectarea]